MTYEEVLSNAKTCMGEFCKACPVCNGKACSNKVPGPGSKGSGTVAIRNYDKWQELCINMDTICENKPLDLTSEILAEHSSIQSLQAPDWRHEASLWTEV